MKNKLAMPVLVLLAFVLGFNLKGMISKQDKVPEKGRVTGIGGIFFKCKDPAAVRKWYSDNLGLSVNEYGSVFEYYQGADSTKKGFLQWSPFKETTKYFAPSTKEFMVNYRVENMEELVAQLKANKVTVLDTIETYSYGKFVHIMDLENNKIELWEANDIEYEKMGVEVGYSTTK